MAASPIWHPPFEWNWSDLWQTCSDRKFELGAVKWESENEFYFVPEERRFARDEETWMWNICFYQPTEGLWCVCGGCFSVLFLHGIRRRNAFGEVSSCNGKSTSYETWKLVPRDSSSTKNKFKICTFRQKVNQKKIKMDHWRLFSEMNSNVNGFILTVTYTTSRKNFDSRHNR